MGNGEIERPSAQIMAIQEAVCAAFEIGRVDLISDRRHAGLVAARHAAMWLCRTYTPYSYPAIGRMFGRRDHTSVIYAVGRITQRLTTEPILAARVIALADDIERRAHEEVVDKCLAARLGALAGARKAREEDRDEG